MALDLKHPEGVKIFKKLCKTSDVLIEPYRPGVMEKLKIGPEILMKENPKLIYARLTGFGQTGYYSERAGHDINYVSLTGLLSLFTRKSQKPTPPVNLAADFGGGGLMCAFGIVAALLERTNSGKGQVIDANMVQGTAYLGSWLYRSQVLPIWGNPPGENVLDSGAHYYEVYETKDNKFMSVGALEPQFYNKLLEVLNLSPTEFQQYGEFDEKKEVMSKLFKTKTQDEWAKLFDLVDACVVPVLNLEDASRHKHNDGTFNLDSEGTLCPKPAPFLSRTPGVSNALKEAPEQGKHTREILIAMKYSNGEITRLEKEGVIEIFPPSDINSKI